ncbi:efflux RND transporter periplasmic adaptor subunit [Micromonospora polyrhachis]|uniref:Multidrug efflux pump subunit AcrA (Membrane-fusion protein) n=1 Tax=Micromonospora polyrhachis TaxID=1282883 RepID=A0A7W7SRQ1_9ACTN|nr:HlyD family efflux transporter periplasmic adaptor subunit [Micromonospora polyrhachis]MBB4959728.1 multidrug efflux pump subunit AcrA (membrane-fusion protein) [Micromonospora polyrhachis]
MTRPRLSALLVAGVVLIGFVTTLVVDDDRLPVTLTGATRGTIAETVDIPGNVTARASATLTAPADGTLTALRVRAGDTVRAGQVLAIIDSPVARKRLDQARQALDDAKRASRGLRNSGDLRRRHGATDKAATVAFADARRAIDEISDPEVRAALLAQLAAAHRQYEVATRAADDAVRAVQRGVAGVNSAVGALTAAQRVQAQQAYDLTKATVDALTLRAPIDGVVQIGGGAAPSAPTDGLAGLLRSAGALTGGASLLAGSGIGGAVAAEGRPVGGDGMVGGGGTAQVGDRVGAGTAIVTVVDVSELGLIAEIDETDVLSVAPGMTATAELDAVPGATYPAQVRSVDLLPGTSARGGVAYRVRLSLAAGRFAAGHATAGRLADASDAPTPRPGMSALIHLRVREAADAVTVPSAAVRSVAGRDVVWVARAGRAEQVPVTLGVQGEELVQIVDGVQPGDQVVVRGADRVRIGQQLP